MTPEALDLTRQFQESTKPRTLIELADAIAALASTVDEETGELTPEAAAELDALNLSLEQKVQGYHIAVGHLTADAKSCADLKETFNRRAVAKSRAAERLKSRLYETMGSLGTARIKTPTCTASIEKSPPRLVITGEVPPQFQRSKTETDTALLRDFLKEGNELEFARLEQSTHLRFR